MLKACRAAFFDVLWKAKPENLFVKILGEKVFFHSSFTRGCTFEDCTFILDEVQNLSWHELKTVLSRIGENSKIILCGDPDQIDANFEYSQSGLYKLVKSNTFLKSKFTTQIELTKQYRGRIPDLIYHIDKEYKETLK